jgi:lipoate-protein ligase A
MYCFVSHITSPYTNLATEDFLLHSKSDDFIILSINDPSVIAGKHQVIPREVNLRFTTDKNIPVLRRISGGGTVYHDHGNLNFSFIRQSEKGKQIDFRYYVSPVIQFLGWLGIEARFEGKNDLRVNGLKISGNAEHVYRERVLHHGTLLFDASLENMRQVLKPASEIYTTRAVESNRTSVANLKPMLMGVPDTLSFMNTMAQWFTESIEGLKPWFPSEDDTAQINRIADSKYRNWEWTYGYAPPYSVKAWLNIEGKEYGVRIHVKDGIIWECDIDASREINIAAKQLIGVRHMPEDVEEAMLKAGLVSGSDEYFKLF